MHWHIDTDIISLIVMIAIFVYYQGLAKQSNTPLRDRRFLRCLVTGIVVTVIDIAASIIMEVPTSRLAYHVLMTLYFVSIEFVIVEWFLYALTLIFPKDDRVEKLIVRAVTTIYVVYVVFTCLNPWTGAIYRLGPNNEYTRGPFFATMIVLFAAYSAALFAVIIIRKKHMPSGYFGGVLLATPVITSIGIIVQLSIPGYLLIMPSYMICLVFAFLFLQNMQQKSSLQLVADLARVAETDVLTGLFNRTGMLAMVQKTLDEAYGSSVVVLIVDIDDLKQINDTLGHSGGDQAIRMVAAELKRHFNACDTIVRYGGDEFLVFFTTSFARNHIEASLERLIAKLSTLCIGGDDNGTQLHCSLGAAYGAVGYDSFETLCIRADTALYHVKRNGKNAFAFYRPEMEAEQAPCERRLQTARDGS